MQAQHSTVRATLLFPPEVQCEYTGIPIDRYYSNLESAVQVTNTFPTAFETATGHRPTLDYCVPVTAYEGVAALGGVLSFPPEHQVMITNQGHVIDEMQQVDTLTVPNPWASERFRRHVDWYYVLRSRYGDRVRSGLAGQEGPVTTAGLLAGPAFFMACRTDPRRAHRLLEVCTETFILWHLAADLVTGTARREIGIADDYAGLLGPALWPEFVLPYYRRIIKALGPDGCHMHTELVRRGHLHHLADLNLLSINFSEDQYLTPADVLAEMPKTPFSWHILTVAEMQQGTSSSVARRFHEIVAAGVHDVRCELTIHTPVENIRAFLDTARVFTAE